MQSDNASEVPVSIIFFGSPLMDIMVRCSSDFVNKYDLKWDDSVLAGIEHDDLLKRVLALPDNKVTVGGSALNSARIAKWVLENEGHISYAGCIGKDTLGITMRQQVESEEVKPLLITLPGKPTGVCLCLLNPEGERSMVTHHGSSACFNEDHLDHEEVSEVLKRSDCVFTTGYFVAHSPGAVRVLAKRCTESQVLALSLSAEYVCKNHSNTLLDILPRVDIVFGNESEVKAFGVATGLGDEATVEQSAAALAHIDRKGRSPPRIVLVTQGPRPVLCIQGRDPPRTFAVPSGVEVVDSVGCGDAMAGAFVAVYTQTRNLERSVQAGIHAAVSIAQESGCTVPLKKFVI